MTTIRLGRYTADTRSAFELAISLTGAPVYIADSPGDDRFSLMTTRNCGSLEIFWAVAEALVAGGEKDLPAALEHREAEWRRESIETEDPIMVRYYSTIAEQVGALRMRLGVSGESGPVVARR